MARVSIRLGNHRCSFKACETYQHGSTTLHLCTGHWRVIRYRGHLAGEVTLVRRWLAPDA